MSTSIRCRSARTLRFASIVVAIPKGARARDLAADLHLSAKLRAVVHALPDAIVDGQRTGTADDQRGETREV